MILRQQERCIKLKEYISIEMCYGQALSTYETFEQIRKYIFD